MNIIRELERKRILIWGYGREGRSTEAFLHRYCRPASVTVYEGGREGIAEESFDLIVKSPGIAMEESRPGYTSQTELFLRQFAGQAVGITGTKGKSTVSAMLHEVLQECSAKKTLLLGNIGSPCLDAWEEIDEETIVVLELSCHQLAHVRTSPHIGAILNLYEEHLDYYGSFDRYTKAKMNIGRFQQKGDYLLLGENVPEPETAARAFRLSAAELHPFRLKLLGGHNRYNAEFVYRIAVDFLGCDGAGVMKAMEGFTGLRHRLEEIGVVEGIRFYDDSISTIPEAAISAARSVPRVQTLIIGGMDRGINYGSLTEFIRNNKNLQFICCYESGKRIRREAGEPGNCHAAEGIREAVELARRITAAGRACVLSPAAASYGAFQNFEERGDYFRSCVLGRETQPLDS